MHDLIYAFDIWKHLELCFSVASLAHVLDLKRMLNNLIKDHNQTMDDYLRTVKIIVDSLGAIQ